MSAKVVSIRKMVSESESDPDCASDSDDSGRMFIDAGETPTPVSSCPSSPNPSLPSLNEKSRLVLGSSLLTLKRSRSLEAPPKSKMPGSTPSKNDDDGTVKGRAKRQIKLTGIDSSPKGGKWVKRKAQASSTMKGIESNRKRKKQLNEQIVGPVKTKKRRTRSYRNSLIGSRSKSGDRTNKNLAVPEDQQIFLDAEIDRVLEEKAIKNNLTATNVKSIIRQVVTNNMVKKMIMSTLRREKRLDMANTAAPGDTSGAEDEDDLLDFEPKLTRAKTKLLLENQSSISSVPQLWPISPMKLLKAQPPSETQILITSHDLPEDSECDDEEYIPTEKDLRNQSDDESGSLTPQTSEPGSPFTPRPESLPPSPIVSNLRNRRVHAAHEVQTPKSTDDNLFKTPPPRSKLEKRGEYHIGLRTRSKLPLNDTPLQDLERQLIPPDITKDMYDFGKGTKDIYNKDYLTFLKEFACTGGAIEGNENEEEEEADPEYNVMEDEEDDHDKEEHRDDRAVKITKKELSELVAEMFDDFDDCYFSSGEEFEDFSNFNQQQPFTTENAQEGQSTETALPRVPVVIEDITESPPEKPAVNTPQDKILNSVPVENDASRSLEAVSDVASDHGSLAKGVIGDDSEQSQRIFSKEAFELLMNQMTQHVQLLAQSYIFNVVKAEPSYQKITQAAQTMITSLWNMSHTRGPSSAYSPCNLSAAVQLLSSYPKKNCSQSPIKKKILEETYFNDLCDRSPLKFPGWVIHTVCGSNVFMHGSLLPSSFNHIDPHPQVAYFSRGEDALIARALNDMNGENLTARQQSRIIADVLLPIRTPQQIFSRIKNIRFHKPCGKASAMLNSPLLHYLQTKTLVVAPHIPKPAHILAPCDQAPESLPAVWLDIVKLLNSSKRYLPTVAVFRSPKDMKTLKESKLSKPVIPRKRNIYCTDSLQRVKSGLPVSVVKPIVQSQTSPSRARDTNLKSKLNSESVMKTLPQHYNCLSEIEATNSTAIPICDYNGEPRVYIVVPAIVNSEVKNVETGNLPVESLANPTVEEKENKEGRTPEKNIATKEIVKDTHQRIKSNRTPSSSKEPEKLLRLPRAVDSVTFLNDNDNLNSDSFVKPFESRNKSDYITDKDNEKTIIEDSESDYIVEEVDLTSEPEEGEIIEAADGGDKESSADKGQRTSQGQIGGSSNNQDSSDKATNEISGGGGLGDGSSGGDGGGDDRKRRKRSSGSKGSESPKKSDDPEEENDQKKQKTGKGSTESSSTSPPRSSKLETSDSGKKVPCQVRKGKKSPVSTSGGKHSGGKRTSKYNTRSAQSLLEDEDGDLEEQTEDCSDKAAVEIAFMDAFILRVQQRVEIEGKNPSLYNTIIQALCEFCPGAETEKDLFLKIEDLLKDYPALVSQFTGFITPELAVEVGRFIEHQQSKNELQFLQYLERWTSNCQPLKSRIIQKYTTLKGDENLRDVIEPFFAENPVMLEKFKAAFSSIYRPQSSSMDFEILDLEMEEREEETGDDSNIEIVKLPEETFIPATHTCPCSCHSDTSNVSFSTRIKHCTKCCLKFQDGKVFAHNGRIMKPVTIKYTTTGIGREIVAGSTCISCLKPTKTKGTEIGLPSKSIGTEDQEAKVNLNQNIPGATEAIVSTSGEDAVEEVSVKPWTREEDFIMLTVYQAEQNITAAITRLAESDLPNRTSEEIRHRFVELTAMLDKLTERETMASTASISTTDPS